MQVPLFAAAGQAYSSCRSKVAQAGWSWPASPQPALPAALTNLLLLTAFPTWPLCRLLKPVLRYGLPDGRDMVIHHCASLALILVSYGECGCSAGAVRCICTAGQGRLGRQEGCGCGGRHGPMPS